MQDLDERKRKILKAIIQTYLETGEPVGSRTISKYTDLNLSSATIRNEMSDLEEMGYILQPHTSAGRIPSDKAYRLYVDTILQRKDEEVSEKLYLGNSRILTENTIGIKENKGDVDQKNTDVENDELKEKKGGRYKDVKKTSDGETSEVHHMPADSASKLERDDGPAIKMEKEDHRQTASCGNSKEAREYRDRQRELIEQGKFREALQMDIDDIHDKFGDKYDDAINEMLEYVDQLEQEEKI